jgi:hypothetical protein
MMKRWVLLLGAVAAVGCARELVREPMERVTLSGGLEVRWRSLPPASASGKASPLVLLFESAGPGPVVLCRVLRVEEGGESPGAVFVHAPEPGRCRYDASSDSVVAQSSGVSPFSLAPAFAWYDRVLYPGGEGVGVKLGEVREGARTTGVAMRVLVEYLPLSYPRLSLAGYAPTSGPSAEGSPSSVAAKEKEGETEERFHRLSEDALRQKQPRALFLRTEYLPPATRVPLEIPWRADRPGPEPPPLRQRAHPNSWVVPSSGAR